jgi:NCAIR mutase (PurE)-related protein
MDEKTLAALLEAVRTGATPVDEAMASLKRLPYSDLGIAKIDHHRALRQGMPEVVFGERKTPEEIVAIVGALVVANQNVLVTRLDETAAARVRESFPALNYNARARTGRLTVREEPKRDVGVVGIVTAGTADLGVAEEAAETLEALAIETVRHYDVGVAGIHRLLHKIDELQLASALIVVAGMEGALPSVVGGMVSCPVIAVPTSVGYGTALGGITALFAMLTSCASGLAVVNIDNGFGAAMVAHRVLSRRRAGEGGQHG